MSQIANLSPGHVLSVHQYLGLTSVFQTSLPTPCSKKSTNTSDQTSKNSPSPHRLVRVFSDILVAFLYFDICHYRQSNLGIENPELFQPVVAGHFQ